MDLAEHSCFIYWGDYKSNWVTASQTKCWFLVRGENRSTQGETSQSREENQQTQPKYDSGSGKRTRATLMEDDCSHHCTNDCSHHCTNDCSHHCTNDCSHHCTNDCSHPCTNPALNIKLTFFCFNAKKPFQPLCHGQNSKEHFNQSEASRSH